MYSVPLKSSLAASLVLLGNSRALVLTIYKTCNRVLVFPPFEVSTEKLSTRALLFKLVLLVFILVLREKLLI